MTAEDRAVALVGPTELDSDNADSTTAIKAETSSPQGHSDALEDALLKSGSLDGMKGVWIPPSEIATTIKGVEATVRASVVREAMRVHPKVKLHAVRVEGSLVLKGNFTCELSFANVHFTSVVDFRDSTLSKQVALWGCLLDRSLLADWSTNFGSHLTLTDSIIGGYVQFASTAFGGDVRFGRVTFSQGVSFLNCLFPGHCYFKEVECHGDFSFSQSHFALTPSFENMHISGDADFSMIRSAGSFLFNGSVAAKSLRLNGMAVAKSAEFRESELGGSVYSDRSFADTIDFSRAEISGRAFGRLSAREVLVKDTVLLQRLRIQITGMTANCAGLQARSGVDLDLNVNEINLSFAEFHRVSTITSNQSLDMPQVAISDHEQGFRKAAPGTQGRVRWDIIEVVQLARSKCGRPTARMSSVNSLESAVVDVLKLSYLNLTECRFRDARGLDGLEIASSCVFAMLPLKTMRWRRFVTRRRVLWEEIEYRRMSQHGWGPPSPTSGEQSVAPPFEISRIYRAFRKSLEANRNESQAGDFYYGEMEMRRRGGAYARNGDPEGEAANVSRAEQFLLFLYWSVSGYGLRSYRAFTLLALVLLSSGLLLSTSTFAIAPATGYVPHAAPRSLGLIPGLIFAIRESVTLTRPAGAAVPTLTTAGAAVDILLRILTPVLLGLAALAVRNRVRR